MNYVQSLVPVVASLLLGAGGCGGSAGNPNGGAPGGPPDPPPGNVTLTVTALDAFGTPVPGASIFLLESSGTGFLEVSNRTDANGRAEIVGGFENVYGIMLRATDLEGNSYEPSHPADDHIDFEVTLHPLAALASGLGNLSVTSSTSDGRQLEFSARLYFVEGNASYGQDLAAWNLGAVSVLPCEAEDCVDGPAGSGASYGGLALAQSWVDPDPAAEPLAIALLLDQGSSVAVTDPADRRLLAAQYFQTQLEADDQVALAAFATDDAGTGQAALLPTQPVTIFPVDSPAFTTNGRSYFPAIESLATLEGGGSPLHSAIREMIDFAASSAPADSRRVVVVLASGGVSDCGVPADCGAAANALREQSAQTGVGIVAVGLAEPSGQIDRKKLGTFAQSEQGAVFWAQDATQVPTIFGRIPEILDGRHGAVDVTVQLQSPVAGAFVSGQTVIGTLHVVLCPWDCTGLVDVPFALRVP